MNKKNTNFFACNAFFMLTHYNKFDILEKDKTLFA
jgi:hypothetical protein